MWVWPNLEINMWILWPKTKGTKISHKIEEYQPPTRAHREIKNQNRDSHTWIFIGNWILMWVCFLHFFYLSTSSAAKMRFYFLPFLQGKNAQNRPKNIIEENISGLEFNFLLKSRCASLNFDFWFLTEPYLAVEKKNDLKRVLCSLSEYDSDLI